MAASPPSSKSIAACTVLRHYLCLLGIDASSHSLQRLARSAVPTADGCLYGGCCRAHHKTNMILSWIILSVRFMLLMVYLIFWQVFKTAFSFSLIIGGSEGANALTQFNNLVFSAIHKNIWAIILFAIPLIIFLIFSMKF